MDLFPPPAASVALACQVGLFLPTSQVHRTVASLSHKLFVLQRPSFMRFISKGGRRRRSVVHCSTVAKVAHVWQ